MGDEISVLGPITGLEKSHWYSLPFVGRAVICAFTTPPILQNSKTGGGGSSSKSSGGEYCHYNQLKIDKHRCNNLII